MLLPPASAKWQPGTWMPWIFGPAEVAGAVITCPAGHAFSIGGGAAFGSVHSIGSDGTISPSVVCPRCQFHVSAVLAGWPK